MKRILLRTIPDDRFPPGSPDYLINVLSYSEAVRQVIRRPLDPQKGADIEEIRKGIRVLDAVDKADKSNANTLELEDADWEHLRDKTNAMQWAFVDRRVLEFIDAVIGADENVTLNVELEAAKDGHVVAEAVS